MPVWIFGVSFIVVVTATAVVIRYSVEGSVNLFHILLSGFLAINLMVCFLELCLYRQRDMMDARKNYWKNRAKQEGVSPARAFMTSRVSWAPNKILAPSFWADSYATYANYDPAYTDDSSCGFNVDIANGFWTLLPTLILLVNFTSPMLPALVVGLIGLVIFYQWIYGTGMYVGSFFVSKRHHLLPWAEVFIYIWVINVVWILLSVQGFYVSLYLVLDQHYGILGFPVTHPIAIPG